MPRGAAPRSVAAAWLEPNRVRVFPELGVVTKRCNECSQCGRRLPPTGVIEIVAGEGRAPLLQNPREPPDLNIGRHLILVHVREALARQGCLPDQVDIVEHKGTLDANLEGPPLLLEIPGVE